MNKKSANKQRHRQFQPQLKPVCAAVLLVFAVQTAQANPTDATVVSGQASFATTGNTLTVVNTPGTIINWQSFSIGANEITHFAQQNASSAVLNRVISNDPSNILGTLQSNGRVFLINPNGILFGAGAIVDVAGLVASSLNLSDADFLAGRYNFTAVPNAGNVSNAGNINAQDGGQIYLVAPNVENSGVITAPNGDILLAAGTSVELLNSNDPNLRVSITAPAGDVTNVGQLIASSGSLGLFGTMVKNSGTVSADSATMQGGRIVFRATQRVEAGGTVSASGTGGGAINLLADMQSGTVNVSGTLDASAPVSGDGGYIDTSAAHVQVADTARITTAAANGNSGNWLIDPTDFTIAATDPANGSSYMSNATLATSLGSGNVTIQTLATGAGNGDIFVNDAVSWASANSLTLNAIRNIEVNAAISNTGTGKLILRSDLNGSSIGTILFGTSGSVALTGGRADLYYNPVSYTDATTKSDALTNPYSTNITGTYTAWMLVNDVGLETGGTLGLQAMNTNLAGNYALGIDIDACSTGGCGIPANAWNAGAGFVPVGNATTNFTGRFDGLGHTISSLTINSAGSDVGLFGVVGASGIVSNVGLIGSNVVGVGAVGGLVGDNVGTIINSYVSNGIVNVTGLTGLSVGGLAGINSGTISNSYVSGGSVRGTYYRVGGLTGYNNLGVISNSYVSGVSVVNAATFGTDVGGMVGDNSGTISNSYVNSGSVSGHSKGQVGGLAGHNSGSISTSYASNGSLTGGTNVALGGVVGGVVGTNSGTVTNTYWNTDSVGISIPAVGGGTGALTNVIGLTAAQMLGAINFTGFNFGTTWWMSEGNTRPFLRSEWNTTITNSHQLQLMAMDLGAGYTLGADIDMTETWSGTGMWSSAGFVPVGTDYFNGFIGKFDGQNHTISNLYINRLTTDNVGLFGHLGGITGSYGSSGSVSNVGLLNASVTGRTLVGALAGNSYGGVINNCYVDGGSVNGSNSVGGLVGNNSGTVSKSYVSNGNVRAAMNNVGGLVGDNNGIITDSYASGTESGNSNVGGLAGNNINGTISNSYVSSGIVYGNFNLGGLVGNNTSYGVFSQSNGLISNSHYDIENVWLNDTGGYVTLGGLYNVGGTGQFNDWLTGGLTLDIANYATTLPGSNGSYTIGSVQGFKDLLGFADNAAYTFSLAADIDLINDADLYIPYLAADFDGANFTISNLNVNQSFNDHLGLFGHIALGSTVSNLTLLDGNVTGNRYVGALAGLNEGTVDNIHAINAIGGSVTGVSVVGGLVGYNRGSSTGGVLVGGIVSNSYVSNGNVSGSSTGSSVGGMVGMNSGGGTISNSFVDTGTVVTGDQYVGGLLGWDSGEGAITGNTVTDTTVNGNDYVGGLAGINCGTYCYTSVGYNDDNHVVGSFVNGGTVFGGSYVGGLVGWSGVAISNSSVSGTQVSGLSNVGGLAGYNDYANTTYLGAVMGGVITSSYVSGGTVTGTGSVSAPVGGLVGYNQGEIVGSYVDTGTIVTGSSSVGGLVGYNSGYMNLGVVVGGSISNSYASSITVNGFWGVGGLVGDNAGEVINSYVKTVSVGLPTTGSATNIGGLAGTNSGKISNSYVSGGTVGASTTLGYFAYDVGGLVGSNNGTISDTYVSGGTVSGSSSVGGLVGYNSGSIDTSYASNGVLSGGTVGGVVGYNAGTVSASFWNTTTAGAGVLNGIGVDAVTGFGSDTGATGLDSAGMMTMSNFTAAGWDIANTKDAGSIWTITEGSTMPLLTSFLTTPTPTPIPISDEIIAPPNVVDEIVGIVNQREKPKPEDEVVIADVSTDDSGSEQKLPMCTYD